MVKGGERPFRSALRALVLLVGCLFASLGAAQEPAPKLEPENAPRLPPSSPPSRDESPRESEPDAPLKPEEGALRPEGAQPEPGKPLEAPLLVLPAGAESAGEDATPHESEGRGERVHYLLERVRIEGQQRTKQHLIRRFVPIRPGTSFDVDDPEIQALRYRLLGTGWYHRVDIRLERGSRPGWVVLVIEVEERRTLVFQQLAAGVGWSVEQVNVRTKKGGSGGGGRQAEPYVGLSIADTNFLGSGHTLGGQLLVAPDQQGLALTYFDPLLGKSRWSLSSGVSFVNGQEYFGGDRGVRVSVTCNRQEREEADEDSEYCQINRRAAVLDYWRTGLGLGTARDLSGFTRLSIDWHGDIVNVPTWGMPLAASELRGTGPGARAPIDFGIERGTSFVSMMTFGITHDQRDSAAMPTRGILASFSGDLASSWIGSSYDFIRIQASIHRWTQTRWGHTLRLGAFAGALYGDAPFFYKFFVSDLTDLMPSRILGLNLDHRPAPNLFGAFCGRPFQSGCGTAIGVMRQEELAARVDVEYVWPLVRGRKKFVHAVDLFALVGLYALADYRDLRLSVPGYTGLARLPVDFTFDLGVRLDTEAGVFQIGAAKLMWLPVQ